MATVLVQHNKKTNARANPNALVDGPTWDNDPHIVTGLDQVDNTSDMNKPVSTAQAAALAFKAPTNTPTFAGTVTIEGPNPDYQFLGSSQGVDQKNWDIFEDTNGNLEFRALNDAFTVADVVMTFTRNAGFQNTTINVPTPAPGTNTTQLSTTEFVLTNAASASFLQAGTGAVTRTLQNKLGDFVSVKDFGAKGDGVTDDTDAIQAAVNTSSAVFLPPGQFNVTDAITINRGQSLFGSGQRNTTITTNNVTADIFTVSGNGASISDIGFSSSVTKIAGAFVNFSNNALVARVEHFFMTKWFTGVSFSGTPGANYRVIDGYIVDPGSTSSIGIDVSNGVIDGVIQNVLIARGGAIVPSAGVRVTSAGDLTLDHVETIQLGDGLSVQPGSGQVVQFITVVNSLFDSSTGVGINLLGVGGTIQLAKISDAWVATNSIGVQAATSGGGAVQEVQLLNCTCSNNSAHGVLINDAGVTNFHVRGGSFASNVNFGIVVQSGVTQFSVIGARIGPTGQFGPNGTGIALFGANDNFTIADNDVSGNPTSIVLASYSGANGKIINNIGYNPVGGSAITVGASPFLHLAGPSPETIYISGGTLSSVVTAGQTIATAAAPAGNSIMVPLGPNEGVQVTYTVAPTILSSVH